MKTEEAFSSSDKNENLALGALIAFLPFLFFLPYVIKDKKFSPYCIFRANQSLITFILIVLLGIVMAIIGILSNIPLIGLVANIICFVLKIVSAFYYVENLILAILGSGKKVFIFGLIDILK